MENRLDLSDAETRALGNAAVEWMAEYYRTLPDRRIMPDTTSPAIRELIEEPVPQSGTEAIRLLEILETTIAPLSRHNGHPRMFGYVASPGTAITAIGDLLASTLNANVTSWRSAPAPTEIEHVTINWIKEILGYPKDAAGLFVSGGSLANFAGLAAARSLKAPGVIAAATVTCPTRDCTAGLRFEAARSTTGRPSRTWRSCSRTCARRRGRQPRPRSAPAPLRQPPYGSPLTAAPLRQRRALWHGGGHVQGTGQGDL